MQLTWLGQRGESRAVCEDAAALPRDDPRNLAELSRQHRSLPIGIVATALLAPEENGLAGTGGL